MAIAKVVYKENASATPEVWMDTTQKTVTSGTMLSGTTALKNDGTGITGNIASKSSSDLTASGATVTAPAGYYPNAASKAVASGSASIPATSITANPTISVNASGLITASVSGSKSVTPTVSAGYVSSGTAGTVSVSGSNTKQLSTQAGITITPTESEQTAVASGKFTTGAVKVGAISSTYVGSGITQRDSTDLTASGATVTAPAGYYATEASKSVASGTAGTPTATKGTVSNHSISVTPSVTNATGYITGSTISGTAVTVDVTELESGTKSITENGTGISVSGYSAVDVDVPSQVPTETLYIWTDRDGIGAWNVASYAKCSVNGAPVKDGHSHVWVNVQSGETIYIKVSGLSISWGDGASTTWPGGSSYIDQSHTYSAGGYYHIELSKYTSSANGRFAATTFASNSNMSSIKSIEVNYSENNTNRNTNQTQCDGCTGIITGSAFVDSITNYAFGGCTSLKNFVVGDMVQTILDNAFNGCVTLENIYLLPQTPPTLSSVGAFTNVPSSCKFIVPEGCLSAYQGATNWSNFSSQMIEGKI